MPKERTWTHAICEVCWEARNPGRRAIRVLGGNDPCCFCPKPSNGIWVRHNPNDSVLLCKGEHDGEDD